MKAFISRTFRKAESKEYEAADYIENLIREVGIEPISINPEGGKKIPEQIRTEMRKCQCLIGVFTKRDKIEGKNLWTIPSNILLEIGIASAFNLPISGFLQNCIQRDELGIIGMEGWQIIDFDTETMYKPKEREKFLNYLKTLIPPEKTVQNLYRFIRFIKEVEIFPNGYGIISHICRLKVLNNSFKNVLHMFTLGANAGKEIQLPSFNQLRKASPQAMFDNRPFFSFRLLDPISVKFSASDLEIEPTSKCTKEEIEFEIKLKKPAEEGFVLNYEWSIGCPNLYPTTKKDLLASGKRKVDEKKCYSFLILGHGAIDDFNYRLVFHLPAKFDSPPALKIYDFSDNLYELGGSFDVEKRATKYIFSSTKMNTEQLTTGRIVAEWIPS